MASPSRDYTQVIYTQSQYSCTSRIASYFSERIDILIFALEIGAILVLTGIGEANPYDFFR